MSYQLHLPITTGTANTAVFVFMHGCNYNGIYQSAKKYSCMINFTMTAEILTHSLANIYYQ